MPWPNIFSSNNNQQQQQQKQQPTPGKQQQQNNNQNDPNNLPGGNKQNGNPNPQNTQNNEPANPLDAYSKMFDNPSTEEEKAPAFNLDPKQMDEIVGGQDFLQGLDPATLQALQSGDMSKIGDVFNHIGRQAYRRAIEHGGVLNSKYVEAREGYTAKSLPSKMRSELTDQALAKNAPNFKHPVVRQQLKEVAQRLQKQHPDAAPEEIADLAKKYITDLASVLNPQNSEEDPSKKKPEERGESYWNDYFDQDDKTDFN